MTHSTEHTLLEDLRAMPRSFWVLSAGMFINRFGTFVVPFFTLYLRKMGYSLSEAGFAVSLYGVGLLFSAVWGGYLSDSIGRRNTLVLSMFSTAAAMIGLALAEGYDAILVLMFLTGLASALGHPAANALVADLVPEDKRLRAYSAIRFAINAGWAFGAATGGFIINYSPVWLFLGDAITSAIYGILALVALPHGVRAGRHESGWLHALPQIVRDGRLIRLFFATVLTGSIFYQTNTTYGLHVAEGGHSTKVYGLLFAMNGVLIICFEIPLTAWTRRWPARYVIGAGYLTVGLGMSLNLAGSHLGTLTVAMIVLTIGEMISMPMSNAYLSSLAPREMRGRYMGVMALAWAVSAILGPRLGMFVYEHNPPALWLGCLFAGIGAWELMRKKS